MTDMPPSAFASALWERCDSSTLTVEQSMVAADRIMLESYGHRCVSTVSRLQGLFAIKVKPRTKWFPLLPVKMESSINPGHVGGTNLGLVSVKYKMRSGVISHTQRT